MAQLYWIWAPRDVTQAPAALARGRAHVYLVRFCMHVDRHQKLRASSTGAT